MHTVILPYFSEAEIDRYERILDHMLRLEPSETPFEFLLAASPRIEPSARLHRAASRVAPSRHFHCPSQVFGYPAGPTAMFRDCMWHVAADSEQRDDFVLWMESDMCPVKPRWIDRLDDHWRKCRGVFAMGCVVPEVQRRVFRLKHLFRPHARKQVQWIAAHINGGACYRRDLIRHFPLTDENLAFDMEIGAALHRQGGFADTPAIAFSTLQRIDADLDDPDKVLLHGYLQDKDAFLDRCIDGAAQTQTRSAAGPAPRRAATKDSREQMLEAILEEKDRQPALLSVYARCDHSSAAAMGDAATVDAA